MVFMLLFFFLGGGVFLLIHIYNRFVRAYAMTQEAWSGVDVQLKRRYDLIPNLVETVKGYATHESELFQKVTQARNMAMGAQGIEAKAQAEAGFAGALKSLFAVAENYPELKANVNFLELQKTLNNIEMEIQLSRRYYNGSVRDFNIKTQVFPSSLVAAVTGFRALPYFEANDSERENPTVKF
jgi:LemA protein